MMTRGGTGSTPGGGDGEALLFVHPHPDDESIACGGTMARAVSAGVRTVVVTCTGGEAGENLAGIDLGGLPLVEHRRRELDAAIAILGVDAHHRLGFRDSGMVGTPDNDHPDCFHRADLDAAALRLAALIRAERPGAIVSDDARGTYGHPDHIKAHQVTVRAVELAADPQAPLDGTPWRVGRRYVHTFSHGRLRAGHEALTALGLPSPFDDDEVDAARGGSDAREEGASLAGFGAPDDVVTTRVDIAPWLEVKTAAMHAHASQMAPDSFFLNVPDELAGVFFGVEEYVLEAGAPFDGLASWLLPGSPQSSVPNSRSPKSPSPGTM
jgi:LmbE family N-acetylglucosaminyl deacetylase